MISKWHYVAVETIDLSQQKKAASARSKLPLNLSEPSKLEASDAPKSHYWTMECSRLAIYWGIMQDHVSINVQHLCPTSSAWRRMVVQSEWVHTYNQKSISCHTSEWRRNGIRNSCIWPEVSWIGGGSSFYPCFSITFLSTWHHKVGYIPIMGLYSCTQL